MHRARSERLALDVRLLDEPCLWCWEIRDITNSELVESSWSAGWMAYDSREAAHTAGQTRLAQLLSGLERATLPGEVAGAGARAE